MFKLLKKRQSFPVLTFMFVPVSWVDTGIVLWHWSREPTFIENLPHGRHHPVCLDVFTYFIFLTRSQIDTVFSCLQRKNPRFR